jgi:hypothetical protein
MHHNAPSQFCHGTDPIEVIEGLAGARGFDLLTQSFVQYRERSPGPRKQRSQYRFPPFPNPSERHQTHPNADRLLHTHYTRKAFLRQESGGKIRIYFMTL